MRIHQKTTKSYSQIIFRLWLFFHLLFLNILSHEHFERRRRRRRRRRRKKEGPTYLLLISQKRPHFKATPVHSHYMQRKKFFINRKTEEYLLSFVSVDCIFWHLFSRLGLAGYQIPEDPVFSIPVYKKK